MMRIQSSKSFFDLLAESRAVRQHSGVWAGNPFGGSNQPQ